MNSGIEKHPLSSFASECPYSVCDSPGEQFSGFPLSGIVFLILQPKYLTLTVH